jgi:hypothetical protein
MKGHMSLISQAKVHRKVGGNGDTDLHAPGGGVPFTIHKHMLLAWGDTDHVSQALLAPLQG